MSRFRQYLYDVRTLPADMALGYHLEGMRGAWKALASRTLHRVVRFGRLVVFAHQLDREVEVTPPPDVRITRASAGDWALLGSLIPQRERIRFETLLGKGRRCLIAWRGDRPVGYAWVASDFGPDVALWPLPLKFPPTAAYLWNLYVLPSERSNGIGSALAQARLQLAKELGFREGWRMVATSNRASLRTVHKSAPGSRTVGELRFLQICGRTFARFTQC